MNRWAQSAGRTPGGTLWGVVRGNMGPQSLRFGGKESLEAPGGAGASQSSTGRGPGVLVLVCGATRHALEACAEGLR